MDNNRQLAKKLTLALLYLTSFKERATGEKILRSWKGYSFEILDDLFEDELIVGSKKAKSVYLTESGTETAKMLIQKFEELMKD